MKSHQVEVAASPWNVHYYFCLLRRTTNGLSGRTCIVGRLMLMVGVENIDIVRSLVKLAEHDFAVCNN